MRFVPSLVLALATSCIDVAPFAPAGTDDNPAETGVGETWEEEVGVAADTGPDDVPAPDTSLEPGDHQCSQERCDGLDNDCNGLTDEEGALDCEDIWLDMDGDGYGVDGDFRCLCGPAKPYTARFPGDCNDANPLVHPEAPEACNGLDEDCDGSTDEGFPGTGSKCVAGVGACAAEGLTVCSPNGTTGACNVTGAPEGTPCDDGLACTWGDACTGGSPSACSGKPYSCDDKLDCTKEECDGTGGCKVEVLYGCAIDGACVEADAYDPGHNCRFCSPALDPQHWSNINDGVPCEADFSGCTLNDYCKDGECVPGPPPADCDDGIPWTSDDCASVSPASHYCNNNITKASCMAGGVTAIDGAAFDPFASLNGQKAVQVQPGLSCNSGCGVAKGTGDSLLFSFPTMPAVQFELRARIADQLHDCKDGLAFSVAVADASTKTLIEQVPVAWSGTNAWKTLVLKFTAAGSNTIAQFTLNKDNCCKCNPPCTACPDHVDDQDLAIDDLTVIAGPCQQFIP